MQLPRQLEEMDVYTRRRLAAIAIAAAVLVALIVAFASAHGGGGGVDARARVSADKPQAPPLMAKPSAKHVKLPTRQEGDGPFLTIVGRTVRLDHVPSPGRKVALTFDDGPAPLTPAFLAKLKQLNVKATFFVIGLHVGEHPELVRQEAVEGHTIANHSYSHSDLPSLGAREQRTEIVRTQGLVEEATGRKPYFFRFPGQDWNFAGARQAAQQGLVAVRFSIDTQDWRPVGTRAIVDNALAAKPGDVIQLHDGGPDRAQTLHAIGPIVRGLRRRGFQPVTLDDLYRSSASQAGKRTG